MAYWGRGPFEREVVITHRYGDYAYVQEKDIAGYEYAIPEIYVREKQALPIPKKVAKTYTLGSDTGTRTQSPRLRRKRDGYRTRRFARKSRRKG